MENDIKAFRFLFLCYLFK